MDDEIDKETVLKMRAFAQGLTAGLLFNLGAKGVVKEDTSWDGRGTTPSYTYTAYTQDGRSLFCLPGEVIIQIMTDSKIKTAWK